MKISFDTNGNKVVKISSEDLGGRGRGSSIQTLYNLKMTHREGIGSYTQGEISEYLRNHGTQRQKELWGVA